MEMPVCLRHMTRSLGGGLVGVVEAREVVGLTDDGETWRCCRVEVDFADLMQTIAVVSEFDVVLCSVVRWWQ
jgi:hypothetical protein